MKIKKNIKTYLRIVVQLIFLALFVILAVNNRVKLWLPVFAAGVILSTFFSRFYCGWMCPMGTLFRPVNWLYDKLHIKRFKTPSFFLKPSVRYALLLITLAAMVLTAKLGIKINLLLYIVIFSVFVTLFFEESFWHHHVCPYGSILSIFSSRAPLSVKIDEEKCSSCGLCQKVCPASAIDTMESKERKIKGKECLVCFKCQEVCPVDIIHYGK